MAKNRIPKVGDTVNLVHAKKHAFPAKVTKVRANGKVNVEFPTETKDDDGHDVMQEIHACPFDPTAQKPDSFHFASEEKEAAEEPAKK